MIQIDDAGSGSLVGGTIIGILRVENLDYHYEAIPVNLFTSPFFEEKKYTDYTIKIIIDGLKSLNVGKDEEIEICQGYMFDKARIYLLQNGYNIISKKIGEPLQTVIENCFLDYVIGLGIPMDYLEYTKYPFHFHKMLKWVFSDLEYRETLCKTGWKSWKKYHSTSLNHYTDYLISGSYKCLKCGNTIQTPCKIKVIKFFTNKEYFIYLHDSCHFSQ
jgi:hypothetical protein